MQQKSSLPTLSVSPSRTPKILTRTTSSSTTSSFHSSQSSAPSTAHPMNFPSHPPVLGRLNNLLLSLLSKQRTIHGPSDELPKPSARPGQGGYNRGSSTSEVVGEEPSTRLLRSWERKRGRQSIRTGRTGSRTWNLDGREAIGV
ncbi:hypothetical protein PGT21_008775 [Puccinia graminis f. sp. tritici]|uniref:Uncharacterized protein n=1 Tax=Puccinia graminis f. sp. tritici TaxID=56615 RepID=A0A5B0R1D5_PUCGR|nr:hypothetical protein PGT21_008775 [Puccinia graminis f. sp. tritici]